MKHSPNQFSSFSVAKELLPLLRTELDALKNGRRREDRDAIDAVYEKFALVYRRNRYDELGQFAEMFVQLKDNETTFLGNISGMLRMHVRHAIHSSFTGVLSGSTTSKEVIITPDDEDNSDVVYEYADLEISQIELASLLDLALVTSPREVTKIMKAAGRISPEQQDPLLKLIAKHLEECVSVGAAPGVMLTYPPTMLEIPRVREVVSHMLRQHVYMCLQQDGVDSWQGSHRAHEKVLTEVPYKAEDHLAKLLKANGIKSTETIEQIMGEVADTFDNYANLEIPDCLIRELEIKGNKYHIPSLRQRIAVSQGLDEQRILVDFNTGDGKYYTAVLLWEILNQQRVSVGLERGQMIYVSPPNVISDLRNRVNPLEGVRSTHEPYYKNDKPTTGAIQRRSRKGKSVEEELKNDIVFASSYLVGRERDGQEIHEQIIEHARQKPVTALVYDESQSLNGGKTWYKWAARLVQGLKRNSVQRRNKKDTDLVLAQLSATPITRALSDYYRTLELLFATDDELESAITREGNGKPSDRILDPDLLNTKSQKYHLRLDAPTDILEKVHEINWKPTTREQFLWRMFIDDSSLGFQEKMAKLALAELDPQLASGDPTVQCSLQKQVMELCEALLEGTLDPQGARNTILITETYLSKWLLRHPRYLDGELPQILQQKLVTFLQKIEASRAHDSGKDINFHVIHGTSHEKDRKKSIADIRASRENGDTQTVVFAFDKCIETGINLSWVDAVIELESARTQAQREQVLGRVDREDNKAEYFLMYTEGSLLGTFKEHADSNAGPINRFRRGAGISDTQLKRIEDDTDDSQGTVGSSIHFGTSITEHLTSQQRRSMRAQSWAQNSGLQRMVNYWAYDADRVKEWMDLCVIDTQSPETLTVPEHTRFAAGLIQKMRSDGILEGGKVLDVHSHGLGLIRALRSVGWNQWDVESLVMDQLIGSEGTRLLVDEQLQGNYAPIWNAGQANNISSLYRGERGNFDCIVMSDGLQNTLPPRKSIDECEEIEKSKRMANNQRIQVLNQVWHSLKPGGLFVQSIPWYAATNDEWENYAGTHEYFGFNQLSSYSGTGKSIDNEAGDTFVQRTLVWQKQHISRSQYNELRREWWPELDMSQFEFTNLQHWDPNKAGAGKRQCGKPLLLHPFLHHQFSVGHTKFSMPYNPIARDLQKERLATIIESVRTLRALQQTHEDLRSLPAAELESLKEKDIFPCPPTKKANGATFTVVIEQNNMQTAQYGQFVTPMDKKWDNIL